MAKLKLKYYKSSKSKTAKKSYEWRNNILKHRILNKDRDILADYVKFLKSLDHKKDFKNFAHMIVPFSKSWNAIRRKHITASNIRKIVRWTKKTDYIYRKIFRYVPDNIMSRGNLLEAKIIKLLEYNGLNIKNVNQIWIHRYIKWLSCTTDGVVYIDDKIQTFVEIKTYSSNPIGSKILKGYDNKYHLKPSTNEYYQIQAIIEILNVPYGIFVFEFDLKIQTIIIERDFDFLWNIFSDLRDKYLQYFVPYLIYGKPKENKKIKNQHPVHIGKQKYQKLLDLLIKNEELIMNDSEESMLIYYQDTKPSEINDGFLEMFTNIEFKQNIKDYGLKFNDIAELKDRI